MEYEVTLEELSRKKTEKEEVQSQKRHAVFLLCLRFQQSCWVQRTEFLMLIGIDYIIYEVGAFSIK